MENNYYCDESCHLENDKKQYMVLGYVAVPTGRIKTFKDDIKALRLKHKNTFEIKWSNLNQWNYAFYSDVIDFFFDRAELNFRAIIVDKNRYIADKCNHDYDAFYYKMYYQLIYHKLDADSVYNIYVDIKDDLSAYRIQKLRDILNVKMGIIQKIQHIRSHEVIFLQICDLLIGAMTYKLNIEDRNSIPKKRLIEKIEKRCGCDIALQTPKSISKFNIFRINI
jgi:hypothetical protein